jgi:hypothetical protein
VQILSFFGFDFLFNGEGQEMLTLFLDKTTFKLDKEIKEPLIVIKCLTKDSSIKFNLYKFSIMTKHIMAYNEKEYNKLYDLNFCAIKSKTFFKKNEV